MGVGIPSGGSDGAANENPRHMAVAGLSPASNFRGNSIQTSVRLVTTVKEYQLTVRLLQRETCRLSAPANSDLSAVLSHEIQKHYMPPFINYCTTGIMMRHSPPPVNCPDVRPLLIIGPVVNMASRIQGEAKPGDILVTEEVYGQVADIFPASGSCTYQLKGIDNPVKAYTLRS
jgi:hypothetical protein